MSRAAVSVGDFAAPLSATAGIQEAIDALPAAGGVVRLPPGRYRLRRSIELRSGVALRGEGPATVLVRPEEIIIPVARATDGSRRTIRLRHTRGLRPGDEIYIGDDESHGWWASHCIVRAIRGPVLELSILHGQKKYRFLPRRRARVTNWFPALWLREVHDVTIADLTIDGGIRRRASGRCDFVVAAVHSHRAEDLRVTGVTVRNWPGDGIGIQGGRGALVTGCIVEGCAGHGYHPGTGLTESVWADNLGRGNAGDGLYFCLRVTHSTVRGNVLAGNRGHGIGGLSDPDQFNAVIGNVCAANGAHGIDADRSVGNAIQGNVCRNNSRRTPGKFAGIYLAAHRHSAVTGNVCVDDRKRPAQRRGLVNAASAGPNVIRGNLCDPA